MNQENIFLSIEVQKTSLLLLEEMLYNIEENRNFLKKKENDYNITTIYQYVFGHKPTKHLDLMIYQIILNHSLQAEKHSPGNIIHFLRHLKNCLFTEKPPFLDDKKSITTNRANLNDLNNLLDSLPVSTSSRDRKFIQEIINLAGFGGKVILEKSSNDKESIELTRGYTFYLSPPWKISSFLKDPKIILIDGFLESVSEIHHLLEKFHDKKESGLIFCRGTSPDVLNTLKVNWERGNLKVLPIIVPFDLEGINTLNDLAAIVGCDIISSNKGNLISSINWDDIKCVKDVDVTGDKIAIRNDSTYLGVINHVFYLKARRASSENVVDVTSLYDRRIRSLTPSQVIVKLRDDAFFVSRSQSIDLTLRSIKSLVDFGVTDTGELSSLGILRNYAKKCAETLMEIGAATYQT